jgi:hypothetical protein
MNNKLKAKIKELERELKEQKNDIKKINKTKKFHKWLLAYLLWNK